MESAILEHEVHLPLRGYWGNLWGAIIGKPANRVKVIVSSSDGTIIHGIYWCEGHVEEKLVETKDEGENDVH